MRFARVRSYDPRWDEWREVVILYSELRKELEWKKFLRHRKISWEAFKL